MKHVQAIRRQEFKRSYAAQVAPVITIRRPNEGGVVVPKVFSSKQARAIGEYDVIFGEAFLCSGRGGYKDDRARAEPNE